MEYINKGVRLNKDSALWTELMKPVI